MPQPNLRGCVSRVNFLKSSASGGRFTNPPISFDSIDPLTELLSLIMQRKRGQPDGMHLGHDSQQITFLVVLTWYRGGFWCNSLTLNP